MYLWINFTWSSSRAFETLAPKRNKSTKQMDNGRLKSNCTKNSWWRKSNKMQPIPVAPSMVDGIRLLFLSRQQEFLVQFGCCFYEMGIYDKAIHSGTMALEMFWHFTQAQNYSMTLAQKDNGDHALAIKTMRNAVLYKTPWDGKKIGANRVLLWEIMMWNRRLWYASIYSFLKILPQILVCQRLDHSWICSYHYNYLHLS